MKYASFVVVPVAAMVMTLSQPAISTIFQDKYVQAPLFLALLSVTYLYTAFGSLSVGNLINGQGYTTFNLKVSILTVVIGFPLSFILISNFGVIGLILTTLTVSLPGLFISLRFIKQRFGVTVDWFSSGKILFSSAVAALSTYVLVSKLPFSSLISLIIGAIVFVIILVFVAMVTRTVNSADINNLREIANGLGYLKGALNFVISLLEKLMKMLQFKIKTD